MAGKKDIVEQALKLIAGGVKEAGPSVAERAAKNIDVFNTAKRLGQDTNDISKLQETKQLMDYNKKLNSDINERVKLMVEAQRQLQEQGAFPMEIGTRFTTSKSREYGQLPWTIMGYHVDAKDPYNRYGYRVRRESPNGGYEESNMMLRDPKLEALHGPERWQEIQKDYIPLTGPKKADGGRIAKGPGGIIDDVVSMAGKLVAGEGEQAAKTGIRAYHGSPHDFDKFDMSKIGTGEGAQSYGHGLYKAQKSDIGRGYRDSIMAAQGIDPEMKIGKTPINDFYSNMEQRLARIPARQAEEGYNQLALLEDLAYGGDVLYIREKAAQGAYSPQTMDWFEKTISPQFNRKGRLYEVNIAADPKTDFINYDAPWEDQPQKVKEAFSYLAKNKPDGSDLARRIEAPIFAQEASDRGVKGIQYLDAGSRGTVAPTIKPKNGKFEVYWGNDPRPVDTFATREAAEAAAREIDGRTRNYVVFDDRLISIIRKYGIAGASAMLGYNLMENLDSKQALAATMADREYKESRPKQAEGGSVKDEDSWLDAAMTVARNAADKATFGTSKYAAAGADYLTDAALDALGYENDADFDRALAEQEYAMKEGEEKNPAAAGAGDIIGYVAPYLAIGPAEGALTTLGYLSDYGGKVGKTGSLFARALGFADGGEVPEQGYLESVGTAINQAANPVRRLIGVRTVDLPEGVDEVDYEELMNLAADVLDKSMLGFGGADPYAKRPKKFPVSPTGKIVDRVLPEEDDIDGALRIAKDVGGGLTPEEVGRRAAQDPATFDAIMQKYAIPDRDIAEYEALKSTVAKQPQDIQQMTHVGAPPMRDVKVDMPLFGGEYNIGSAPYNVAQGMSGAAQTAYDFKTAPLYMTPMTAPIGAGLDVAEGVATGDPLQASMAALGAPGKMAKGAIIGLSNYAMDPAEAQAGRERFFSKLLRTAEELPMEKMTGQQALAMLRKGTSPEELRWTGTEDFLANTPQVTKQNLIDYINKNRVQLNEIRLGGSGKPTSLEDIDIIDIPAEIRDRHPEIYRLSNKVEGLRDELVKLRSMPDQSGLDYYDNFRAVSLEFSASQAELARAKDAMRKEYAESIGGLDQPVKFGPGSSYGESLTTPGGKNYSENLFALPKRDIYTPFVDQMRKDVWNENYKEAIEGGFTEERARAFADKFNNLNANQLAKFLGKEDELDSVFQAQKSYGPQYTGGHWSDVSPDVLFHTRTSELTYEPPGANRPYRVHNVEETQSDPGQAGRKRGFKDQKAMAEVARLRQNTQELREKLKSEQARIHAEHQERMAPYVEARTNYERELRDKYKRGEISLGDMNRLAEAYPSPESELTGKFRSDTDQIVKPLRDQIVANENEIARIGKNIGDIPVMPYVTSTEKWTDLAIKKELDRAFDNGSDYFSWTPGEAQAERFDLSRHISKIEYSPDDGSLLAYDPNGRMVVNEGIGDPSELDEYIGKELADKVRAEEKSRNDLIGDAYEVYRDEETGDWAISLYGEQSYDDYGDPLVFDSKGEAKDYLRQMMADEYRRNPISLSGLDLKVGGEGMRGYYDKLYLKRVQNVLKESTGIKPEIEVIEVNTPDGPRKQLGVRLTDEMREKARFSDFNKGGRVTGGNSYGNDQSIANALALTREY